MYENIQDLQLKKSEIIPPYHSLLIALYVLRAQPNVAEFQSQKQHSGIDLC